ncbi:LuxR C-terminal-related transcriptional regulator [Qipengyuania sp.]
MPARFRTIVGDAVAFARPHAGSAPLEGLEERFSKRESQILHLLIAGFTSREIGVSLGLSVRTVELYRVLINRKLDEPQSSYTRSQAPDRSSSSLAA